MDIGFENLKIKLSQKAEKISCKNNFNRPVETNKGVHIQNRKINLKFLTKKDEEAIKIGKLHINNYALSL